MLDNYKKITKEDIDFPNYCLFFIENLEEEIKNTDLENNDLELKIHSTYPYCYDAFALVKKTFEKRGVEVKIPTFRLMSEDGDGTKHYLYKFDISKIDDLPF